MSDPLDKEANGRRKRSISLAIGSLAVLALIVFAYFHSHRQTSSAVPAPLGVPEGQAGKAGDVTVTPEAMKLAEISVAQARIQQAQERLEVSGAIKAGGNQLAQVTPTAPGKATRLLVSVGQNVRKGQVLALLDSAELARAQADYKQAVARSQALESTLTSQRELANLGQFGSQELEDSRSQAVSAEKALQEANRGYASAKSQLAQGESDLQRSKSEVSKARVEVEVRRAHLSRAESLPNLVSLQQMERLRADASQAEAELSAAIAAVGQSQAALRAAQEGVKASKNEQPLARQEVAIRRSAVARENRVYQGGYSRKKELAQAETDARMAGVEREAAAENVRLLGGTPGQGSELQLLAPISGSVQQANLTLGETVDTAHLAFSIVNLEEIYADLSISPADVGKVKAGDPVELFSDADPKTPLQAELVSVGASSDPVTRMILARARVKKPTALLRSGSFVKATIVTEVRDERLTVPVEALQDHQGRPTLYVAKARTGAFEVRHVTLGAESPTWREVTEGLKSGERLATHGTFYLKSEALKSALSDGCCAVGN